MKKGHYLFLLGFLSSNPVSANAPIVPTGENPVWAVGGEQTSGQTISLITAPSQYDVLVTDVVFSITGSAGGANSCVATIRLNDNTGNLLASYRLASRDMVNYGGGISPTVISHTYRAGLPIAAGNSLEMVSTVSCGGLSYSISGLKVHP